MEITNFNSTGKFKISEFITVWGMWTTGSFITCAVAIVSSIGVISLFSLNEDHWFGPLFLALFGLFVGGLQALILSRRIPRSGWWVPITIGSWLAILPVVWLISQFAPSFSSEISSPLLVFAMIGAITGFTQWLFLRPYWRFSIWWIPACIIGAVAVGLAFGEVITSMVELSMIGLVPYAITGLLVAWLYGDPLMRKR